MSDHPHPVKKRSFEETFLSSGVGTISNTTNKTLLFYQQQEIDTLKGELDHERSLHLLDVRKLQQTIDRLERKVILAQEEASETKELLELQNDESSKVIAQLKDGRTKALQHVRELEMEIDELVRQKEEDCNDAEDAEHWKRKCFQLQQQVQLQANNEEVLNEQLQILKHEFMKAKDKHQQQAQQIEAVVSPQADPAYIGGPRIDDSDVSSQRTKKEMTALRLQVADLERSNRQHQRRYEDLMVTYKKAVRDIEQNSIQSKRITRIQKDYDQLSLEKERLDAMVKVWVEFQNKLHQFLSKKKPQSILKDVSNSGTSSDLLGPPTNISAVAQAIATYEEIAISAEQKSKQHLETCTALQNQIEALQNECGTLKTSKLEIVAQNRTLQATVSELQQEIERSKHQTSLYQREADSLRTLLSTFESATTVPHTTSKFPAASVGENSFLRQKIQTLQVSWDASKERNVALEGEVTKLQDQISTITATKTNIENELDVIKNKYNKLRAAWESERNKVTIAEERAITAEQLAGKGSFNPTTTRVLHFSETPLMQALHEEINTLKRQLELYSSKCTPSGARNSGVGISKATTPATALSSGDGSTPAGNISQLDLDKINQRLKENFKEQIALFREGVYLLTGYKIDMITNAGTDRPTFRVRSVYAEQEEDHLLFQWPKKTPKKSGSGNKKKEKKHIDAKDVDEEEDDDDQENAATGSGGVTSLDLLNTPLARLLSTSTSYQYMTKFQSVPAFLSSVQLTLFEQQTCVVGNA